LKRNPSIRKASVHLGWKNWPDACRREIRAMDGMAWFVFVAAAILEVGGDALIRTGLRGDKLALIVAGFAVLGSYGVVVNTLTWDFTRLLGVYVAVFAITSALFGRFVFHESASAATWLGLALVLVGALVIQLGE
jgi:drug/metabolite transporter superfamily protein YnfA